jgi:hypothetical protein
LTAFYYADATGIDLHLSGFFGKKGENFHQTKNYDKYRNKESQFPKVRIG